MMLVRSALFPFSLAHFDGSISSGPWVFVSTLYVEARPGVAAVKSRHHTTISFLDPFYPSAASPNITAASTSTKSLNSHKGKKKGTRFAFNF